MSKIVNFIEKNWGITVHILNGRFEYPLKIIDIRLDSEAYVNNIQKGDIITHIKIDDKWKIIQPIINTNYVSIEITNLLINGGNQSIYICQSSIYKLICSNCKKHELIEIGNEGIIVCNYCSVINKSNITSKEQEWRNFENKEDQCRVSFSKDDTTFIANKFTYEKLSSIDIVYKNIKKYCKLIELPEYIEIHAKTIIKDYSKIIKNIEAISLVTIYISCIQNNHTRTIKEILSYNNNITKKEFNSVLLLVKKNNNIQLVSGNVSEIIPRFCNRLNIFDEKKINQCLDTIDNYNLYGHPSTIACVIIHKFFNTSFNELEKVSGMQSETIKSYI